MILFRGKKFTEAADAFAKVPQASEYYPDSRYWIPLCRLEQFREKILPTGDKALILTRSRVVGQELLSFADYALAANGLPEKKKQELLTWAETAYVTVADIYLYPEVALPSDVLAILDTVEKKFTLDDDARGRVLKLRIDALQKLGKLDESLAELDKFLKLAKPEDVGPVLRGLFRALTDDVRDLVKRGDKESVQVAGAKVEQAKKLCEKLTNWINSPESKLADQDKALRIENNRYDLAELFLAVRNYTGAIDIYKEIGGDKPWVVEKGQTLKIDCVYGMARAYEGLAEQAQGAAVQAGQKAPPYSPEAKRNYETALEIWRVLQDVASAEGPQTVWDRRYHVFYCSFRVGNAADVAGALKKLAIIERPNALGGKDPVLQMRFRELLSLVAAALGA
jgi:tetratricopeptide (TPR) repeat protein